MARRVPVLSIGATAVLAMVVVTGLALRAPAPSVGPGGPAFATADDGMFRLELTTPRGTYGPDDAIEPVATVTYHGPKATETISHAASPIGFRIEEVGGQRQMAGGMRQPCKSTVLANGTPTTVPFAKAGSPDNPNDGFDRAWYNDPVFRLPAGTWRIIADLLVNSGEGCGGEPHNLTVENTIQVVAANAQVPTPSPSVPTPSPSVPTPGASVPTPSATTAAPVVASAADANVRLTLTTPRGTYTPVDPIDPLATVTYLGPLARETLFHAASPIGFVIEEVGGVRTMGGGMDTPCLSTELAQGASATVPFEKAGSSDNPQDGFDQAWYEDPILRLPAGTWRIIASLDVYTGPVTCGGDGHQLTVENVIVVVGDSPTP
jgi:hypothetical protein